MLDKPNSFNGKLILEAYQKTEIKADISRGWAKIDQKQTLKGLRVLIQAHTDGGEIIPVGSIAYIKEESLHTQAWAKNKLKSDTLQEEFIVVNVNEVEYIVPPPTGDAA